MVNDKLELFKKISNVIVGHCAYNTIFESIKYENTVPEYSPVFEYAWDVSENSNIVTVKSTSKIDCAGTIDRKSTLAFDITIYYYIENDELSQIQLNVANVESNSDSNSILINDFINNIVQYLITGAYAIFDGREYVALESNEEGTKIMLDSHAKVGVGFKTADGVKLSIRSIFINDLIINYNFTEKNTLVDTISEYSPKLGEDVKSLIANKSTDAADIFKLSDTAEPVDIALISKDYKDVEVDTTKSYLFNTILHKIKRSGMATLSDVLTLCDGNEIELDSVNYIVNF